MLKQRRKQGRNRKISTSIGLFCLMIFAAPTLFASNMGHTTHLRYAEQDLDRTLMNVEGAHGDGSAEFKNDQKVLVERLKAAKESLATLRKYVADHGVRDE